ncbi:MAG: phosphoenolpyruvate--protein phosphotransferase [Planctomycetes bacterium]|nr:phosphoenolpyruvate--protein phosphotransferase [Planctomycetota bacterium]
MNETTSSEGSKPEPVANAAASVRPGITLKGTPVASGLVLGVVHRKDYELSRAAVERVPLDQVERELNRFHQALSHARAQLGRLKTSLAGKVPKDDARILDVHVAYLKDSVFISDVENLILEEQMSLEAAIGKVISDFDRIFRLVQNETLRERAVDLRDVGIRVLRHLEKDVDAPSPGKAVPENYVLVARELSIVDMFNLSGSQVLGILTESGGLTSHAAILARSMRVPTITGIEKLLDHVREGDFVILDASEGLVRVNPEEVVVAQYRQAASDLAQIAATGSTTREETVLRTRDGEVIHVAASCGNLPEVDQAQSAGLRDIGLYRTELMYLIDKGEPSRDALARHYTAVLDASRGGSVTFRLLHADSSLEIGYLHERREQNPALGRAGIRALLSRERVLRRQLQALLVGGAAAADGADGRLRIALPFVTDCGELRRFKEILFEERLELRKNQEPHVEKCEVGVVVETPAAALGARDLAREADFLLVSLDSLQQHLLAADRDNADLVATFQHVHPIVLRALREVVRAAHAESKTLAVFGVTAVQPGNAPFLLGIGVRAFCVAPASVEEFVKVVAGVSLKNAKRSAEIAAAASAPSETTTLVDSYRHGYSGH